MSNFSLSPLFRRSIGFDRFNDLFDYAMQSEAPNYPHYNIEKPATTITALWFLLPDSMKTS